MMTEYILLAAMAAAVLVMLLLRTNTAIAFFSLCAGSVLLSASGANMSLIATSVTSGISTSVNVVQIVLLFTPLVVCVVMLRKHLAAAMLPMAFIPAVCTAALGALFVAPLLSDGTEQSIANSETWSVLVQYQEPIVGLGLIVSIVMIALTIKKPHVKHHKKGRH